MQLLVLASTRHVMSTLQILAQQGLIKAVVCPDRESEDVYLIREWAAAQNLPFFSCTHPTLSSTLAQVCSTFSIDAGIVFGFPWKIPVLAFDHPKHGFFNVHFSLLPAYRGPMPVFWQIKNGEATTGVTIHKIDGRFDTGPIVSSIAVPSIPGETEGLCSARLANIAVKPIAELIHNLSDGKLAAVSQTADKASYHTKPADADITIDWAKQGSEEILRLIDACNPVYMGAKTFLKGSPVRLVEVSPTDAPDYPELVPGTIVHADVIAGLFVVCADRKLIRINIVYTTEGIFTGAKLAAMGLRSGDCFGLNNTAALKSVA